MFVLGITGSAVSGKSFAASRLAEKHGFIHLEFTKDLLAPILKSKGKTVSRQRLIDIALDMRKKEGNAALMKRLMEGISGDANYVVAGLRYPEEVHLLRQKFGNRFKLLAIKSKLGLRYARTIEFYEHRMKSYAGREPTFKEFLKQEDMPTEKIVKRTMRMADFSITNNGKKDEFIVKLDNLVKRLRL